MSRIHHKNLVTLVGYCHENDKMILVYKYMSHGTLNDHLHGKNWPSLWVYSRRFTFLYILGCVVKISCQDAGGYCTPRSYTLHYTSCMMCSPFISSSFFLYHCMYWNSVFFFK